MSDNQQKKSKGGIDFGKMLFGRTNCGREIENIMDSYPHPERYEQHTAKACQRDIQTGPLKPEHCKKLCNFNIDNIDNAKIEQITKNYRKARYENLKKNCTCDTKGGKKTRKQRRTKSRKQKKTKSRRQRK